jgi:hypothetical protein
VNASRVTGRPSGAPPILAFCHIEKAAGTSLIGSLREAFPMRFAAMRPLTGPPRAHATLRDLELTLRVNPFLRCVSGHAVVPWGDLGDSGRLSYITLLREPVSRAASQYAFWVQRKGKALPPERFLEHHTAGDFQVRKIAGTADLDRARRILEERFLLVGTVEAFDEFLVLLAGQLGMPASRLAYRVKNTAAVRGRLPLPEDFRERLAGINRLDAALYEWVQDELVPRYRERHAGDLEVELAAFRAALAEGARGTWRRPLDLVYRNAWVKPLTGLIRLAHGLRYEGSYGVARG